MAGNRLLREPREASSTPTVEEIRDAVPAIVIEVGDKYVINTNIYKVISISGQKLVASWLNAYPNLGTSADVEFSLGMFKALVECKIV